MKRDLCISACPKAYSNTNKEQKDILCHAKCTGQPFNDRLIALDLAMLATPACDCSQQGMLLLPALSYICKNWLARHVSGSRHSSQNNTLFTASTTLVPDQLHIGIACTGRFILDGLHCIVHQISLIMLIGHLILFASIQLQGCGTLQTPAPFGVLGRGSFQGHQGSCWHAAHTKTQQSKECLSSIC